MKRKLVTVTVAFGFSILLVMAILAGYLRDNGASEEKAEQIIALNEIGQLARAALEDGDKQQLLRVDEKVEALQSRLRQGTNDPTSSGYSALILGAGIACLAFLILLIGYVYAAILRPFDKMKQFAESIAAGNFDLPLRYERSNYFGAFTWAFDSMRREIIQARSSEREAIENNKTVIATLSHDIKTPIASIRAYAEALEANLDNTPEKRAKYLEVMIRKCEEVARLTDDLFLHSLSDLDKLKIHPERVELAALLEQALEELSTEQDISFEKPAFACYACVDRNRMVQVIENLVANARKYAKTPCTVTLEKEDSELTIRFRDYGEGIPDEDLPFIFNKFYRGRNCGSEPGSGLGLSIVRYIMEQHKGRVALRNLPDGLEVTLTLSEAVS